MQVPDNMDSNIPVTVTAVSCRINESEILPCQLTSPVFENDKCYNAVLQVYVYVHTSYIPFTFLKSTWILLT